MKNALDSINLLVSSGYELAAVEDFHEMFVDAIKKPDQMITGEDYISDTVVCYLKLLTGAHLKLNRELFEAFILGEYLSLDQFISEQGIF